jgi:hypothetical protein
MRTIIYALMGLTLWSGFADADRDRRDDRRDRRDDRRDRRDDRRDNRADRRDDRRDRRVDRNLRRQRYRGAVRANRRAITRERLYHSNGTYRFHNGRTVVYRRPVFTRRYYDVRVRPQVIVENYPAQYGYIWVNGSWSWNGSEWAWSDGHYAPDPAISVYYDDGSYDVHDDYVDE